MELDQGRVQWRALVYRHVRSFHTSGDLLSAFRSGGPGSSLETVNNVGYLTDKVAHCCKFFSVYLGFLLPFFTPPILHAHQLSPHRPRDSIQPTPVTITATSCL
jgi:hypothetical protein